MIFEFGSFRLKQYSNKLCWEMFEYREIVSNKGANAGSKRMDWVSMGLYPRTFAHGLKLIYERSLMADDPKPVEGIEAAIKEAQAIEKRLEKAARGING